MYVDENVSAAVSTALSDEHDVMDLAHTMHKGKTDAWHLQQASVEQQILLTRNANDFRFIHRIWSTMRIIHAVYSRHAGILTTAREIASERWVPVLRSKLSGEEDFGGRLLVWDDEHDRWLEDKWRPED